MLVSAIQQHESAISVRISPLEPPSHAPIPSHTSRLLQSTMLSSLHHTASSHWLSILHMVMYMFQCYSLLVPPSLSPAGSRSLFICLHLYSCPAIGSSVHFPRFHIYSLLYLFFSFWFTYIPFYIYILLGVINDLFVVQLLSHVWLFATAWTAACQTSMSFTISQGLLKFMSIELVMPSNHLIPCHPLLVLPLDFPSVRVFSNESALCIRWPKYWSFSFNISPSNEYSGWIFFRIDWLDLLAVQRILKSLLQHHIQKHQFFGTQTSL